MPKRIGERGMPKRIGGADGLSCGTLGECGMPKRSGGTDGLSCGALGERGMPKRIGERGMPKRIGECGMPKRIGERGMSKGIGKRALTALDRGWRMRVLSGASRKDFFMSCSGSRDRGFFTCFDKAAFWSATLFSFLVYFFTCAPSVTLEDCGELATAGDYAGVPHPPGYPSWTMCAWIFSRLLSWVSFRGQPNPAWAIAVMSAFWGALAAGLTAMLVSRFSADLLRARRADGISRRDEILAALAGASSALVFAFSPVMWSQSVIVEVYSFGQFFMALVLLLAYRWTRRPSDRVLLATAFFFGLGLTNYQVLLLALPPLLLAILLTDIALFRDFALLGVPLGLLAGILKLAATPDGTPGFFKLPPLDPESPVGGALNWTVRAGGAAGRGLSAAASGGGVAATHCMEAALIVAGVVFLASAAVLGRAALLRSERGEEPDWTRRARFPALCALVISGVALMALALSVPGAVQLPWARLQALSAQYEASGSPDPVFHWGRPTLAFAAGIAALWVFSLFTPAGGWYALGCTGALAPLAILLRKGALLGLVHPLSGWFAFYAALALAMCAFAFALLQRGRTVALSVLCGAAGISFYGYMAVAGDALPPLNWGYPRTWEGFKHAITRGQYEQIIPESVFTSKFIGQLATYFVDLRMQFTLALAPWALVPFAAWRLRTRRLAAGQRREFDMLPPAALAAALVAALAVADKALDFLSLEGLRLDKALFLLLLVAAAAGLHAFFVEAFVPLVRRAFDGTCGRSERLVSGIVGAGTLACTAVAGSALLNPVAEFVIENLFGIAPGAAGYRVFDAVLTGLLAAAWLSFSALLAVRVWRDDRLIDTAADAGSGRWHLVVFACFVMMSFVLIALAKPRGDVQDAFIQKVKFIASHGLWATWIGCGAALSLSLLASRARRGAFLIACAAAALAPLVPIHENYCNFGLADITSAADQNGHDFGWQFGNYQLRGAPAISEELSRDEEPLPDPFFPPEMTPNAVFYGGTDPGRFVPTYMIYAAHVRPDVFLITQNALADPTYLDTMRGLYADQIWMPTSLDNQEAFSQYAEDVRSGRRPDNGGLSVSPDGRVSVNGALSVMEINAIIAEKIFRRNRALHDFYVEESYAMQWMYPYLSPHGLIMKVNAEKGPIGKGDIVRDMDFWDWYSRRLLDDPKFPRDLPARKSFNKLRASLAGLYAARGDLKSAERAYKQALSLYVYSPETAMRLVREVYLPQKRFDDAVGVVEQLAAIDPNNPNLPLVEVRSLRDSAARVAELMPRLSSGPALSDDELLELVGMAIHSGDRAAANMAMAAAIAPDRASDSLLLRLGLALAGGGYTREAASVLALVNGAKWGDPAFASADQLRSAYRVMFAARDARSAALLRHYLRRNEQDWEAWIDFALASWAEGDSRRAAFARAQALRHGGARAREALKAYQFLDQEPRQTERSVR